MKENNGKEPTAEQLEQCRRRADEVMDQMEEAGLAQIADTVIYVDEIEMPVKAVNLGRELRILEVVEKVNEAMKKEKLPDAEAAVRVAGELMQHCVRDWLSAHPEEADRARHVLQRIHDGAMEDTRRDYTEEA